MESTNEKFNRRRKNLQCISLEKKKANEALK